MVHVVVYACHGRSHGCPPQRKYWQDLGTENVPLLFIIELATKLIGLNQHLFPWDNAWLSEITFAILGYSDKVVGSICGGPEYLRHPMLTWDRQQRYQTTLSPSLLLPL